MTAIIHTSRINRLAHEVMRLQGRDLEFWKKYCGEIAGLPVAMRRNGLYLAFAYMMEREEVEMAGKTDRLGRPGSVLDDLRRIDKRNRDEEVDETRDRLTIALWVDGFRATSDCLESYMSRSEELFSIVDIQKRVAGQLKILAGLPTPQADTADEGSHG